MIRPITCVCFLAACGSGLYLYQAKHRVHVIDAQIEKVVHQTEALREQARILHAEWTLLDQPDRLLQLSTQFLTLQPTKPAQFASLKDLDARLPAVPPPPQTDTPAEAAIAAATPGPPPGPTPDGLPAAGPEQTAIMEPPIKPGAPAPPPSPSAEHSRPRVADPSMAHAEAATSEPVRTRPVVPPPRPSPERSPQYAAAQPRRSALPEPRPVTRYVAASAPAYRPRAAAARYVPAPAYGGSVLGMAHANAAPAPPAPMPVWTDWNNR
jgi:hypothetical protein